MPVTGNASGRRGGVTLVELLVIIAVVALILAIVLPATRRDPTSYRVVCGSNLRSITQASLMLADENDGVYVPLDVAGRDHHLAWVNTALIDAWVGEGLEVYTLRCPTRLKDTVYFDDVTPDDDLATRPVWELGYFVMAGRPTTLDGKPDGLRAFGPVTAQPGGGEWVVPVNSNQAGDLPIAADRNELGADTLKGARSVYPHKGRDVVVTDAGTRPTDAGAAGGNTAFMDGSVRFNRVRDLREYHVTASGSATNRGYWSKDGNVAEPEEAEPRGSGPVF